MKLQEVGLLRPTVCNHLICSDAVANSHERSIEQIHCFSSAHQSQRSKCRTHRDTSFTGSSTLWPIHPATEASNGALLCPVCWTTCGGSHPNSKFTPTDSGPSRNSMINSRTVHTNQLRYLYSTQFLVVSALHGRLMRADAALGDPISRNEMLI